MRGGVVVIAVVALLLAACGGSSRLSASAYRAKIAQIKRQAATAETNVALGLHAQSLIVLKRRLDGFARATQRIGDEVAKLKPPANAEAANTELAQGLHDTAIATRKASAAVPKLRTPAEAIAYLEHSSLNAKGAHEVNDAFRKLTKLGYASAG
jgi:hypothetical protein